MVLGLGSCPVCRVFGNLVFAISYSGGQHKLNPEMTLCCISKGWSDRGWILKRNSNVVPLLRCAQWHTIRDRHFSDVSGSTRELWSRQIRHIWPSGKLSPIISSFPLFFFFPPFFMVHQVDLQMRSSAGLDAAWWTWCVLHRDRLLLRSR